MADGTTSEFEKVAHLARRAGFGLPPMELEKLAARGLEAAVDHYVAYERIPNTIPLAKPALNDDPNAGDITPLQIWWLDRMIRSPRQLEEKMTLFWHTLFATSNDKVDRPSFMFDQNMLLRRHALGDFQSLFGSMCIDPAMLVWLDGDGSTKDQPNENFARECMELFSIGVGHYTQHDVREAARAFTGWSIDAHYVRQYEPGSHDAGRKTFLGRTGHFTYSDVARILANHPECGRFLARKLWTHFAHEHPDEAIITELAGVYRSAGRSMRDVVQHMFQMPAFYRTHNLPLRLKSPVEHAVTAVRELHARVHLSDLNDFTAVMGQSLFYPPNVGGWPSGARWLSSATVVGRFNFAEWLLERQPDPAKNRVDLAALLREYGGGQWAGILRAIDHFHLSPEQNTDAFAALQRFTRGRSTRGDDAIATLEALLQLAMVTPEYYCA